MNATMLDPDNRLLAPLATIPACQRSHDGADWFPAVDILEDAEEYLFRIDLPEMEAGDVRVAVEKDGLLVSGKRLTPSPEARRCLRIERPQGYFERRFALPDDASRREIASAFDRGVLELHVCKVSDGAAKPVPPIAPFRLRVCPTS
jgi:HSP20 family protein